MGRQSKRSRCVSEQYRSTKGKSGKHSEVPEQPDFSDDDIGDQDPIDILLGQMGQDELI
jgi:hypothetical protein